MERLDKRLANTGRWSRKEARELIRAGRVAVEAGAAVVWGTRAWVDAAVWGAAVVSGSVTGWVAVSWLYPSVDWAAVSDAGVVSSVTISIMVPAFVS